MPNISVDEIASRLIASNFTTVDASGDGQYESIETALSQETGSGIVFILVPTGPYTPSSDISLGTEQAIIGIGYPEVSGVTLQLSGSNSYVSGVSVTSGLIDVTGADSRIERCCVTGSESSDIAATTIGIGGESTHVVDLYVDNRRIETTAPACRIQRCEVRGNITDQYSDPTAYNEVEINSDDVGVAQSYIEGTIGGSGSGTKITGNHLK